MIDEDPSVLIVEDDPDIADIYAAWLNHEYDVRTAHDGREAIESLEETIEVILLDRRMADLSGDDVLDTIRDREHTARIAMVTAIDPDFDIIEMRFDDYLVKPVAKETLIDVVEDLMERSQYDSRIQRYYSLVSKQVLLQSEKSDAVLDKNDEYQQLVAEIGRLQSDLDETLSDLANHDDFKSLFEDLGRTTAGLHTDTDNLDS